MNREFGFFITEDDTQVKALAERMEIEGAIPVGNTHELIDELAKRTQRNDEFSCSISGAWLEVCVEKSVRRLLNPIGYGDELAGRTVAGVVVDLTKCIAWVDRDLSDWGKRILLTDALGETIATDERLTILP